MPRKKLSVVLLTHNRARYLRESLAAILAQTFGDFELLVLDNHSSDETPEVVIGLRDPRLTYVRQPEGVNAAENHGIGVWMTRTDLVIVTHDDDVMEPTMLEKQVRFFAANPGVVACATNVRLIDEDGRRLQDRLYSMAHDRLFRRGEYIKAYLDEKLWLPAPTYMFRKGIVVKAAPWSAKYPASEDVLNPIHLNTKYKLALLAEPLLAYRQHRGQECRNIDQSGPLLATFAELVKRSAAEPRYEPYRPAIHAFRSRYQAQQLLLRHSTAAARSRLVTEVKRLKAQWTRSVTEDDRLQDAAFPLEILLHLLEIGSSLDSRQVEALGTRVGVGEDGPAKGYRHWLQALTRGNSLFSGYPDVRRIAILGSLMAAYLIGFDAERQGIDVVCCLDSSPARLGQEVAGIRVVPHQALAELEGRLDAVVLSNEVDNAAGMKRLLFAQVPDRELRILSWKEMAERADRLSWRGTVAREKHEQPRSEHRRDRANGRTGSRPRVA